MEGKKKTALVIVLVIIAALAAVLAGVYFYGKNYFSTHFAYQTSVNGQDVSKMEMDGILSQVKADYPTTFTIKEKDGTEEEIDFSALITNDDIDRFVEEQKEKAGTWYESLFTPTEFTSSDKVSIKEKEFKALVKNALESVKRTPAENAYIDLDTMTIVPEKEGNELNLGKACTDAWKEAEQNVFEVTLDKEYLRPSVRSNNKALTSVIDEYEQRIGRTIKVAVAPGVKKTIEPETLKEWISYNGEKFTYDKDEVLEYTRELEEEYNTAYSLREFETSTGGVVYVGQGAYDSYAGWLMNEDETYQSILKAVRSKKSQKAEVAWDLRGYALEEDGNDIGGTYIEVSVDDQHMWYYEDHKLILDTDVVTGTETDPKRRTPRGIFYLLEMASPYVMHGDYGIQPCEYFIKVTWDGVAIHDADWQSSFGGTQYMYAGSHGCINTPHAVVAKLYERIYAMDEWQMPVIIY